MSNNTISVMIVDDHQMVRLGMRSMLIASGIQVVAEAESGQEALQKIAIFKPDVVLMDIRMPDMDGLAALEAINEAKYPTRVIMITTYKSTTYLLRALAAGAAGFMLKNISIEELLSTVRAVAAGKSHVDQHFLQSVLRKLNDSPSHDLDSSYAYVEPLTPREMDVLQLMVEGLTNQRIAKMLGLSVYTVKGYVQNIFQKLNVNDRTQAVVQAIRRGLVK